jgi:NitT/TauT family transport system permease protein
MSADLLTDSRGTLEVVVPAGPSLGSRVWGAAWPKLLAVALFVGLWQLVYASGWRPDYIFPSPATSLDALTKLIHNESFWPAVRTTMTRALVGFAIALLIGSFVGLAVARIRVLRLGVGSMITGLQTMPSIAWFPLAIVLFGLNERAIFFVVVLGAAPSIANGVIAGVDQIPPQFLRLGRVMGARGFSMYRHFVLPAALPAYVSGLNQGWAFAWRSLMAGELLGVVSSLRSLGGLLNFARDRVDMPTLIAVMIVILVIGMLVDSVFSSMTRSMRKRRGLAIDG